MSVFVFASAKAAPGVTTAVLALAATWPPYRPVVVAECDADGGDIAAWYGLAPDPGLVTFAAQGRGGLAPGSLLGHTQLLPGPGDVRVLAAPASPRQTSAALTTLVDAGLGSHLAGSDLDVLVDAGRLRADSRVALLATHATATIFVARPTLAEVRHLRDRVAAAGPAIRPHLLLVGERPYRADEVAAAVDAPVLGVVVDDARGGAALTGRASRGRGLSRLARSAVAISERLVQLSAAAASAAHADRVGAAAHADHGPVI